MSNNSPESIPQTDSELWLEYFATDPEIEAAAVGSLSNPLRAGLVFLNRVEDRLKAIDADNVPMLDVARLAEQIVRQRYKEDGRRPAHD